MMDPEAQAGSAGRAADLDQVRRVLANRYGIRVSSDMPDLGGGWTLNLLVLDEDAGQRHVARVYQPFVTAGRLAAIQDARRYLTGAGVPCAVAIPTQDGGTWVAMDGRLVEVEPYVVADGKMDTRARLEAGLPLLGQIHALLRTHWSTAEGRHAPVNNSIAPERLLAGVSAGTERLRRWDLTPAERDLADLSDKLVQRVAAAERPETGFPRQLVHGDYWDNNVLLRDERIVLVADLDFMGERARIDDLALTLYYTNSTFADDQLSDARLRQLRTLVDAYDSGLDDPLTLAERRAIPLAMARTALGFIAMIADADAEALGRRLAAEMAPDIAWAAALMDDLDRWQEAMA